MRKLLAMLFTIVVCITVSSSAFAQVSCASLFSATYDRSARVQWALYSHRIQSSVERALRSEEFQQGSPIFIKDLTEKFGFHIQRTSDGKIDPDGKILVPSVQEIMSRIEALVSKFSDHFSPVIAGLNESGKIVSAKSNETIPSKIFEGIMSTEVFFEFLKRGQFPMGDGQHASTGAVSFIHDLSHFSGFIQNPQYMKYVYRYSLSRQPDRAHAPDMSRALREYYITEGFQFIPPSAKLILRQTLELSTDLSVQKIQADLSRKSEAEIHSSVQKVLDLISDNENILQLLGGATREPHSAFGNELHGPILFLALNVVEALQSGQRHELNKKFAQLKLALIRLAEIPMEEWFVALQTGGVKAKSNISLFLHDENIWDGLVLSDGSNRRLIDIWREAFPIQN